MSFLSILKTIGKDALEVAPIAGAGVSIINPVLGSLITGISGKIQSAIVNAETTVTAAKSGGIKSDMVVSDFQSAIDIANDVLGSAEGKQITFDATALQSAINGYVTSYNATAALKNTIKIVPLATTPAPTPATPTPSSTTGS